MDELVARVDAARERLAQVRSEASRAYAEAVAAVVADEAGLRGVYGAQARAGRRMTLSPQRVAEILKELNPRVDASKDTA